MGTLRAPSHALAQIMHRILSDRLVRHTLTLSLTPPLIQDMQQPRPDLDIRPIA